MCPERRESLIYQSDFTSASKHWREWKSEFSQSFRRDGYYHIGAKQNAAIRCVGIPIVDFKVSVDAQFTDTSDKDALLGVVFRAIEKDGRWGKLYFFDIQWTGWCALYIMDDPDKWELIGEYRQFDFINGQTGINSLMVEMVGEDITGSVNGHVAVRASDRRLARGDVGVCVSSRTEYYEARFRNFRLYSIESVEEAVIMPAPMPAPPSRPTASAKRYDVAVSIEKVTTGSSASSEPRVAQPAASAERPPDVHTYLEGILADAGMTDLTTDLREEMIQELSKSLHMFIIGEIMDHMPARHHEAFARLHEEKRPQTEINRFIDEHMPNPREVFAGIFEKFRRQYGGK